MKRIVYTDSQFALVQRGLRLLEILADFDAADRAEIEHVRAVGAAQANDQRARA